MSDIKCEVFYGGNSVRKDRDLLKSNPPHIVVGTPGRIKQLAKENSLSLKNIEFFVVDECDQALGELDMRSEIQEVFVKTPLEKQVMMFSATLSNDIKNTCRRFMKHKMEFFIDDESKLTLHGLTQH